MTIRLAIWTSYVMAFLFVRPCLSQPTIMATHGFKEEQLLLDGTQAYIYPSLKYKMDLELSRRSDLDPEILRLYGHRARKYCQDDQDTNKLIDVYLGFGRGYLSINHLDSTLYYDSLALQTSITGGDMYHRARVHQWYAWSQIYDQDYKTALRHAALSYAIAKSTRDTTLLLSLLGNLIKITYESEDRLKSYELAKELTQIGQFRKDTNAIVCGYYTLVSIYEKLGLFDRQLEAVHELLGLAPAINKPDTLSLIYKTASDGYLTHARFDSALYYVRKNIQLKGNPQKPSFYWSQLGEIYMAANQFDSARYYAMKGLTFKKEKGLYIDTYQYVDLGDIEFKTGRDREARAYYIKAESEINKASIETQRRIYKSLYNYYDAHHANTTAFSYLKKYQHLQDSLSASEAGMAVLNQETARMINQIELLKKENELQAALSDKDRQLKNIQYGGTFLLVLLGIIAFIRYKKQKELKDRQNLLNERLRISRELHDEVGSSLSGIAMYSHVAKEQVRNKLNAAAENSLAIMQKSAGEMVQKLSDLVWLINPEQDTLSELWDRLEEYARQMAAAKNMHVKIDLPSGLGEKHIPLEARRNIYLVCKEAINNAVKYSRGTELHLAIKDSGDTLNFSIQDNGFGFDWHSIRHGNGLKNMEQRAEEIGAAFDLTSTPEKGTVISLAYKIIH